MVQPGGEPGKENVRVRKGSVTCRNTCSLGSSTACVVTAVTLPVLDHGSVENRCRFLRTERKGRIERVSLLQVKEHFECMELFCGTEDRQGVCGS